MNTSRYPRVCARDHTHTHHVDEHIVQPLTPLKTTCETLRSRRGTLARGLPELCRPTPLLSLSLYGAGEHIKPLRRAVEVSWKPRFLSSLQKLVAESERWLLWQQCITGPKTPDGPVMEHLMERIRPLPMQELDARLGGLLRLEAPWPQVFAQN